MTREDIIRMALEAGFFPDWNWDRTNWHAAGFSDSFERFAALVAAAERNIVMNEPLTKAQWQRFEDEIRADEREACAKVCEDFYQGLPPKLTVRGYLEDMAKAIRARGNT